MSEGDLSFDRSREPSLEPGASSRDPNLADAIGALAAAMRHDQHEAERLARKHKRRAFWWRLVSLVVIIAVGATLFLGPSQNALPHIARVNVDGMILNDPRRDALFERLTSSSSVKAVVLHINSPGGTTVGGEALYDSIRRVAEVKPVVAVLGEVAASAAFITAIAADHIVARGNTITGSIGVIYTAPNVSGLLEKIGVQMVEVKTGPNKAEPSLYGPVSEEGLEDERALIADSFDWFLGLVRERRAPGDEVIDFMSDGRVVSGREAQRLGLVDAIGGEASALAWLRENRGVDESLPLRNRSVPEDEDSALSRFVDGVFGRFDTPAGWDVLLRGSVLSLNRHIAGPLAPLSR